MISSSKWGYVMSLTLLWLLSVTIHIDTRNKRKHHPIDLTNQVKFLRSVLKIHSNTPAFVFTRWNLIHIVTFAYLGNLCSLPRHERLCQSWKSMQMDHSTTWFSWLDCFYYFLNNTFFKFILIFLYGVYMQQTKNYYTFL